MRFSIFALVAILASPLPCANAWEADEFRSGMTEDEVVRLRAKSGLPAMRKIPVSNIPGAYALMPNEKNRTILLTFCSGRLYQFSRELEGGLTRFAMLVRDERQQRGIEPAVQVLQHSTTSMVTATWQSASDEFEFLLAENVGFNDLGISAIHTDLDVVSECRKR